jgi:hypothetical protein
MKHMNALCGPTIDIVIMLKVSGLYSNHNDFKG